MMAMLSGQRICVVVPAYNEQERIASVLTAMPAFVDRIWLVDDASTDQTVLVAKRVGDPRVQVLQPSQNSGVGAAIRLGYQAALAAGDDIALVMAGDGQMDPDDIPALVAPIVQDEYDYVKGNRLRHSEVKQMPFVRRNGSAFLGWLTGHAIGVPGITDSQCGFTAIRVLLLKKMPIERLFGRYGYPNDLLSMVALAGGRIGEVTVRPVYSGQKSGLRPRHFAIMLGLIGRAWVRRKRAENT